MVPAGNSFRGDRKGYLSPAPQAEPQAAGFSSGLSPAPQAEPQAAGFSSGLSPAPQAEPQAAAGAASIFLLHPNRFESAIFLTSIHVFRGPFCSLYFLFYGFFSVIQVRTILCYSYQKDTVPMPPLPPGLLFFRCPGKEKAGNRFRFPAVSQLLKHAPLRRRRP